MMRNQAIRYFHTGLCSWSSTVSKSHLAKLRKKTGYTFSNCKKALEENDNNVEKAEKWLNDQAQALGWTKLSKLEGRPTAQGLIGIAIDGKKAAMVEVNCETDFVARNKSFKEMINLVATSCLQYAKKIDCVDPINKEMLDGECLKRISCPEGKSLADHVALLVSSVGENVSLKRGICVGVKDDLLLAGYAHPGSLEENKNVMSGKYGSLLLYSSQKSDFSTQQTSIQLCQHIVGMNPILIKKPQEANAKIENLPEKEAVSGSEVNEDVVKIEEEKEEETAMLSQDFLLDPSVTVEQILSETGITVHDFVRYETGERIAEHVNAPELDVQRMSG